MADSPQIDTRSWRWPLEPGARTAMNSALAGAFEACRAIVRQHDADRYAATLFAPKAAQAPLFALYAFASEIARVREQIHEVLPGEIRHQWWREALSCSDTDGSRSNPVVIALRETMARFNLPPEPFLALIEARTFDLYDDPMPTWDELEGYCGETTSALIRLASLVLAGGREPGSAALCGLAGVVHAFTGLLRAFPIHARRNQCFLPHEVLIAHGVTHEEIFAGRDSEGLRAALAAMRARARGYLAELRGSIGMIDPVIAPAFYVVSLAEPCLDLMDRRDYRPFESLIELSPLQRLLVLGRTRWKASRARRSAA